MEEQPVLQVKNLSISFGENEVIKNISYFLNKNEILGIAGVSGNGQRELFEALIGVRKIEDGGVLYEGQDISQLTPGKRKKSGIAHIPDDRIAEGLIKEFDVAENLIFGLQRNEPYRKGPFLNQAAILEAADDLINKFSISTPSPNQIINTLSGGNLQKVILAREISQGPKCLLANQPTRGLDVGIIEYVHEQLLAKRDAGVAILMISEDLDEIFSISSRIAVIFKGEIVGMFNSKDVTREKIGLLMAGVDEVVS